MRIQPIRALLTATVVVAAVLPLIPLPAWGQFPAESTLPMDRRPNRRIADAPTGPAPRTSYDTPDLSARWGYSGYTSDLFHDYEVGTVPMTPLGESLFLERQANEGVDDPEARCLPTGVPRRDPYPSQIIQLEDEVIILFEGSSHSYRHIYMNQELPPREDLNPQWYGHSVGHWEGDELVVETTGFNGRTWLDLAGHPTSDQLHVVERYSRPDFGHLRLHITLTDPVMYTKSAEIVQVMPLFDTPLLEYICLENERDVQHLESLK